MRGRHQLLNNASLIGHEPSRAEPIGRLGLPVGSATEHEDWNATVRVDSTHAPPLRSYPWCTATLRAAQI